MRKLREIDEQLNSPVRDLVTWRGFSSARLSVKNPNQLGENSFLDGLIQRILTSYPCLNVSRAPSESRFNISVKEGHTRAHQHLGGWVIEPLAREADGTSLKVVSCVDPGG